MEIAKVGALSLKIRGKNATLGINPTDKSMEVNAVLLLGKHAGIKLSDGAVLIDGPGEYEVGGIKISGITAGTETVYSLIVDDVSIIIGNLSVLSKAQTKLQEANIVLVQAETVLDATFITGFTPSVVLFYGEKASDTIKTFEKEGIQELTKFQTTADKLPLEMVTVLLQ